jgi:type I restriction enzyme S subunit
MQRIEDSKYPAHPAILHIMFRQMSKETKKLIPELRFPEFVKDGEWEERKLGDIGDPLMCKRILKEQTTTNSENAIPFYKIGTFGKVADSFIPIELYYEYKSKYSFPKQGDILISASGTIGRLVVYDGIPAYFQDSNIVWLGNDEELVLNYFLYYCYSILNWQTSDGGVIKRLYNSDLKNIQIRFPKKKFEQQKIASCLSSLDELITAHNQKLKLLKDHKKGLMQNLFPREGEKVPKYRFPEFVNDGEWEKNTLSNLGQFLGGGTPNRSITDFWEGDIPWISSSDINEDDIQSISITRFISEDAVKKSATKRIPKGSILFVSRVGVGKLSINKVELCTSQDFTNFISNTVLNYYIVYYFTANKHLLQSLNQGTSIKGFSKSDLENFELIYPKNPKEQQKVASCLSALDELIPAQAEKIEQLQLHKKGLMQGLFPENA